MDILGEASASLTDAKIWARGKGATSAFVALANWYWQLCPIAGVRPEVAYAQAANETGFGKFGGVLDATFKNPCGLKAAGGSSDHPSAFQKFPSWAQGVKAHIDHLALYAGALGYPHQDTPDPRHFSTLLGKCPTVESLSGRWATSTTYGPKIIALVEDLT